MNQIIVDIGQWVIILFAFAEVIALLTIPSVLLNRRANPRGALAWLLFLFAVPLIGVLAWWLIGRIRIDRKRRRRKQRADEFARHHEISQTVKSGEFSNILPERAIDHTIFTSLGNSIEVLLGGEEAYPAMEQAIESAHHSINILFYIWKRDSTGRRLRDLLVRKAQAGVQVRILTDSFGSPKFMGKFARPLIKSGAKVASFFPSRIRLFRPPTVNFINHRKIIVIDESIAFTGGMNIGDEYAQEWHDVMIRVEGQAVDALEHIFLDDWYFASKEHVDHKAHPYHKPGKAECAVVSSGPDTEDWIHHAFFFVINQAQTRLWLLTPYFIPTEPLIMALRSSANRGVDVRVLLPSNSDIRLVKLASRSYYRILLEAGVRVFEYQGPVIHAKTIVIDDQLGSVGTANFDTRSLQLSFEVSCFFGDACSNRRLADYYLMLLKILTRSAKKIWMLSQPGNSSSNPLPTWPVLSFEVGSVFPDRAAKKKKEICLDLVPGSIFINSTHWDEC